MEWYWLNVHGERTFRSLSGYLPAMPPKEIQVRFTGAHGELTLREAFRFYRLVSQASSSTRPKVALDFGCGWGRITRFFIKDFSKDKLFGVDPLSEVIETSQATNPWATFEKIDLYPPIDLPSSSVDLIFAFSGLLASDRRHSSAMDQRTSAIASQWRHARSDHARARLYS
jgi:Methyltransferase domain